MLVSLLVMLNTHLLITVDAGIDQYSLYVADLISDRLNPSGMIRPEKAHVAVSREQGLPAR